MSDVYYTDNYKNVSLEMINEKSKRRKMIMIHIDDLVPMKENEIFPMDDIETLADSLLNDGQEQPLLVRSNEDDTYTIISGERRYRAAKMLVEQGNDEWEELECIVVNSNLTDLEMQLKMIRNNHYRSSIPVENKIRIVEECAKVYTEAKENGLVKTGVKKREWISQLTGFSPRSVQEYLATLKERVDGEEQNDKVVSNEKSVDEAFESLKAQAEHKLKEKLQLKVSVKPKKMIINYTSTEELENLLSLIGIEIEDEY